MGYLDDIIIFSNNELEHLQHIEEIFNRPEHFGLKMKKEKCDIFKKHIQYLGHLIVEEGFTPSQKNWRVYETCQEQKHQKK